MQFNFRLGIFALAIVFGVFFSLPSLLQTTDGKKITLGLDLQGGLHMLLGVKTDEAVTSRIKSISASIKHYTQREDIYIDNLTFDNSKITFELLDKDDLVKIQKYIEKMDGVELHVSGENLSVNLTKKEIVKTKKLAIDQAIETIRNRLDQFGLAEPLVAKQGKDKI